MFFLFFISSLLVTSEAKTDVGRNASIRDFPYQVSLGAGSAAIISENWVISAEGQYPHSTVEDSFYTVKAGTDCLSYDVSCRGSRHDVDEIVKHERNATELLNRLLLMHVKEPFVFDETRQPIPIISAEDKLTPGRVVNVSGFDMFRSKLAEKDTCTLKYAEATIVDSETCNNYLQKEDLKIPEGYFCTNYGNNLEFKGASFNEGGAILVVDGKLAGISEPYPGYPIFLDLAYYHDWITQHVDQLLTGNEL